MARMPLLLTLMGLLPMAMSAGCCSPYHSDQGALAGGLLGAGAGAVVGHALGNTAGGALVGAGVGAVSGGLIGHGMDQDEARNRAMIAQQLGRQVDPGAVTVNDVLAMTRARVNEDLVINHIQAHGMAAPLQTNDLIALPQQGVSERVIAAMQAAPPPPPPQTVVVQPAPPPVIIEERPDYYGARVYVGPRYYHHGW